MCRPRAASPSPTPSSPTCPRRAKQREYALDLDGGTTVFALRDAFSGWTLVRMLPTGLLDAPYRQVYLQIVLVSVLLLAILLIVVYLFGGQDLPPAA